MCSPARKAKEGKRLSKVLKSEAKAEAKAIDQAIRELADLQKMQRNALKEETRAVATHAKALRAFHKEDLEYLAARARYEKAQAELAVVEDTREAAREHAMEVTEMMQEKSKEVEWLRAQKAADDVRVFAVYFAGQPPDPTLHFTARTFSEARTADGKGVVRGSTYTHTVAPASGTSLLHSIPPAYPCRQRMRINVCII